MCVCVCVCVSVCVCMFVYLTATSQQEEQHGDGWDSLHGSCGPLPINVDSCVLVQCSLQQGRSSSSLVA